MAVHNCGRCGRKVDITDIGWIHLLGGKWQDDQCARAIPDYLYEEGDEMINICAHCGEKLIKVTADSDDRRYKHLDTRSYDCALPPDSEGWRKNAVPILVADDKAWRDYRFDIQQHLKPQPVKKEADMIEICRNCGTQVGVYDSEYKHLATLSIWCGVFDAHKGYKDKEIEPMTVASKEDAISYRNVILHGAAGISMPLPKGVTETRSIVKEEPSYMMFARANVRDNIPSTASIVKELVARIDRLETEKKERGYNGG